jgi:predicted HTH transcriptional regulator
MKTLVAFANTAGGKIIIGVADKTRKVVARVFRELDLVEQWGTGVRRIFEQAREMGLPEPKIEEVGMRVRFTVYLAEEH